MKTNQELYLERVQRIQTAVALGRPDRVPVVTTCTGFAARYTGTKMSDFCSNPKLAAEIMLRTLLDMGEVDGSLFALFNPYLLSMGTLNRVEISGIHLPEDAPYQIHEQELMQVEDYDIILRDGYDSWLQSYQRQQLPETMAHVGAAFAALPEASMNVIQAGLPILNPLMAMIPFELFGAARSMSPFVTDLFRRPEKVAAACEVALESILPALRGMIRESHAMGVFLGFGRSNRGSISRRLQEKFVYPHAKKIVDAVLAEGAIPVLHCDQDWTRDVDLFLDLPKGKCILQLDGTSDIFALKKSVGHHICLMGDVQAAKLTLCTPEEVFSYSRRLIEEIGPEGFILCQGCDMPVNAKPENFRAMIAAAHA